MIAIIADDLTGACDTAVKLKGKGWPAKVFLNEESLSKMEPEKGLVAAVTTNSRSLTSEEAFQTVKAMAEIIHRFPFQTVYKKVDSLLRGNVTAEILAVMEALDYDLTILQPAIPSINRFVINGKLVHSPNDSEGIDIIERFNGKKGLSIGLISVDIVHQGPSAIFQKIMDLKANGYKIIAVDCDSENSLSVIADTYRILPFKVLPAGASGWIQYLLDNASVNEKDEKNNSINQCCLNGHVLVVAGTSNEATKEQIKILFKQPDTACTLINVDRCLNGLISEELSRCIKRIDHLMINEPETIVLAVDSLFNNHLESLHKAYVEISSMTIVQTVANIAKYVIENYPCNALFITGGETAYQVLEEMATDSIDILEEILPGVPLGLMHWGDRSILVALKSGRFGTPSTIKDYIQFIRETLSWRKTNG